MGPLHELLLLPNQVSIMKRPASIIKRPARQPASQKTPKKKLKKLPAASFGADCLRQECDPIEDASDDPIKDADDDPIDDVSSMRSSSQEDDENYMIMWQCVSRN